MRELGEKLTLNSPIIAGDVFIPSIKENTFEQSTSATSSVSQSEAPDFNGGHL